MEIENLGEIADTARDYVYADWDYWEYLKKNHTNIERDEPPFRKLFILVERYYGPKPKDWKP